VTGNLPRILAAGVSVRSLARSAIAAGYEVLTADGYGDRDLIESSPGPGRHLTVSPFDPDAVADHVTMPYDAVAYTSNFENHADALERIAAGRVILGNPPDVLRDVRRAERVREVLDAAGLPAPAVYAAAGDAARLAHGGALLAKPRRGGGGGGVRHWRPGEPLLDDELLQEWVDGVPGSLVFVADGREVVVLGVTRQLIGDAAFGASGHRWCGNLLGGEGAPVLAAEQEVTASATASARAITRAFGLRGINGIDFIARNGTAVVIEVNPRWTAAVELVERSLGMSLFPAHASACEGDLPGLDRARAPGVVGKAVTFATADCVMPNTDSWLADGATGDVPLSGSPVPRGAPICTLFASEATSAACHGALAERARAIGRAITP
jgi:predicted ATP-grasp superfamily ATP-dependent carboligase